MVWKVFQSNFSFGETLEMGEKPCKCSILQYTTLQEFVLEMETRRIDWICNFHTVFLFDEYDHQYVIRMLPTESNGLKQLL